MARGVMTQPGFERRDVPLFDRSFFRSPEPVTRIGEGELGGKARGLVLIRDLLASQFEATKFTGIEVYVPKMVVVTTDVFDAFMDRNGLRETALSDLPDDRMAETFLRAEFPTEVLGDLRALVEEVHTPLAIRSSSLLEDALFRPFAGVYETKMVPNNQPDTDTRFLKLVEAIKFVYASTYFCNAKSYIRATERTSADEKMAVIIQEVVGERHDERFYPDVAGVGRSYNFVDLHADSPQGTGAFRLDARYPSPHAAGLLGRQYGKAASLQSHRRDGVPGEGGSRGGGLRRHPVWRCLHLRCRA
jgi:hypothetical protein